MWVILVGFPLMFFGMGLAIDAGRMIIAGRQMSTATYAAALAGAYQFVPGKAEVSAPAARAAAVETLCVARTQGAVRLAQPSAVGTNCPDGRPSSVSVALPDKRTVRVTTKYTIPGLMFIGIFGVGEQGTTVTRTATICQSGVAGPTNGYCTRPGL